MRLYQFPPGTRVPPTERACALARSIEATISPAAHGAFLVHDGSSTLTLAATTTEERDAWTLAIGDALAAHARLVAALHREQHRRHAPDAHRDAIDRALQAADYRFAKTPTSFSSPRPYSPYQDPRDFL